MGSNNRFGPFLLTQFQVASRHCMGDCIAQVVRPAHLAILHRWPPCITGHIAQGRHIGQLPILHHTRHMYARVGPTVASEFLLGCFWLQH